MRAIPLMVRVRSPWPGGQERNAPTPHPDLPGGAFFTKLVNLANLFIFKPLARAIQWKSQENYAFTLICHDQNALKGRVGFSCT
jgi:hypothetical protein